MINFKDNIEVINLVLKISQKVNHVFKLIYVVER